MVSILVRFCHQWWDTLLHWTVIYIRHCPQSPSVLLCTSLPRRHQAGSSPSSPGLHCGSTWQLEMEDWSSKTILAQNRGSWPATNESWTSELRPWSDVHRSNQLGRNSWQCLRHHYMLLKKKPMFPESEVLAIGADFFKPPAHHSRSIDELIAELQLLHLGYVLETYFYWVIQVSPSPQKVGPAGCCSPAHVEFITNLLEFAW